MARHVDEVVLEAVNGRDEQIADSLSKAIYDLISSATTIHGLAVTQKGRNVVAVVIWDDA